jgi:flagellin
VDEAMNRVSAARARLGAMQNKLHSTVNNIGIVKENLEQARSRVADVDVAEATSDLVKDTILSQAGLAVLAQANNSPRETLRLFV